jgi:hypothetical protein
MGEIVNVECKDGVCVIKRKNKSSISNNNNNGVMDVNRCKGKVDQVGQMGAEASAIVAVRHLNRFKLAVTSKDKVAGIKVSSEINAHADRDKVDAGIHAEFKVNRLGSIDLEFSKEDAFVGNWKVDSQWIPDNSSASLK